MNMSKKTSKVIKDQLYLNKLKTTNHENFKGY